MIKFLKERVNVSVIIANVVMLALFAIVFRSLNSLNKDIRSTSVQTNLTMVLTEEVRVSTEYLRHLHRQMQNNKSEKGVRDKMIALCDSFNLPLDKLDSTYNDMDIKKVTNRLRGYIESIRSIFGRDNLIDQDFEMVVTLVGTLADKIVSAFGQLQDYQYKIRMEKTKELNKSANKTKRKVVTTLIVGLFGVVNFVLIAPGKISQIFKTDQGAHSGEV